MATRTMRDVPLPTAASINAAPHVYVTLHGIDQAGPSYTAHVFLNNPEAGPDTARTPEQGYLGAIHVYGFGYVPDPGAEQARPSDEPGRNTTGLPMQRRLLANREVLSQAAATMSSADVTIVPVPAGGRMPGSERLADVPPPDSVSIETHDHGMTPAPRDAE